MGQRVLVSRLYLQERRGKVFIASYDAEPPQVKLLRTGVFTLLIVQKSVIEGTDAVLFAHDYLTGHKTAIAKSVLLTNVVATAKNASQPSVARYFYDATPNGKASNG